MTKRQSKADTIDVKELLNGDGEYLRAMVQALVQSAPDQEMTAFLGAEKSERTASRRGYRAGQSSTEISERCQRSEKALTAAPFEMYVQGMSTRKVKAITEELCGHGFSASA